MDSVDVDRKMNDTGPKVCTLRKREGEYSDAGWLDLRSRYLRSEHMQVFVMEICGLDSFGCLIRPLQTKVCLGVMRGDDSN